MTAAAEIGRECENFLFAEAKLLDDGRLDEWLKLLSRDIQYRIPVRQSRENKDGLGFSSRAYFMDEDHSSLVMRVKRLVSDFAWAENPRTRTRRIVANVQLAQPSSRQSVYAVTSNCAVFCHRGDTPTPLILTCERHDELLKADDSFKILSRLVLLDTTVLGLESLSILL